MPFPARLAACFWGGAGRASKEISMRILRAGVFLALLFSAALSAGAQSSFFRPFTSFRVIRTEHFEIIFPRESEMSARALAVYADAIYEEMSAFLGIDVPFRIPVVFNPHTGMFNGLYNFFPTPHIVLFDTPMDIEWTTFPDSMKGLFIHELAHAISMNARTPGYRTLRRIFGSWVAPVLLNSPFFMIEGVAVSLESASGFGRANDPLVRQNIRQAVHEGSFPTPMQSAGLFDLPAQGVFFYEIGGAFSMWLKLNFGYEKHARLWQAMGGNSRFSLFPYRSGFYRIFSDVYGMSFLDAWAAFADSFAIDGLEENADDVLPTRRRFFSDREIFIDRLVARGDLVFMLEGREGRVRVLDAAAGGERSFRVGVLGAYDIDVSADGSRILVSGYRFAGDRFEAVVVEYRTDNGRRTGRSFRGLYRARYFRDGVLGIRRDLHDQLLVFDGFDGGSEVLLRGDARLMFSGPAVLDDGRFALVAAREGARELWLYDFHARELFRVDSDCGDQSRWTHMRGLGASDGTVFFSHNADDRMYRLAALDFERMTAVFSERDFSGGVFMPVSAGGAIYYRGAFFSTDRLLRFPESPDALSGARSGLELVRLDPRDFLVAGEAAAGRAPPTRAEPPEFETSRYFAIRHMNPFNFWLPLPLIRNGGYEGGGEISLDGGGIFTMMADPTQRNFVTLMAFADVRYRMAMIEEFSWQNTALGFPLTLDFSDMVIQAPPGPFRDTRITLSAGQAMSVGRWSLAFSLAGSYVRIADNFFHRWGEGTSAYTWNELETLFALSAGIALSNRRRRAHEMFGTGLSLSLSGATLANVFGNRGAGGLDPRIAGMFRATSETRFPVSLAVFGAYDWGGMDTHGISRRFGSPMFVPFAPTEFRRPAGLVLDWYAGAEAALGLFSFEIQNNVSHLYFNRVQGSLALRNALFDGGGHPDAPGVPIGDLRLAQSLSMRIGLVTSAAPFAFPFFFEPNVWASWKLSNAITGTGSLWQAGVGFSARL